MCLPACPSHLTHLALVHIPRTLVVVGERDEVGNDTQQAVREELLVGGHSSKDLVLKDSNIHEELERKAERSHVNYLSEVSAQVWRGNLPHPAHWTLQEPQEASSQHYHMPYTYYKSTLGPL